MLLLSRKNVSGVIAAALVVAFAGHSHHLCLWRCAVGRCNGAVRHGNSKVMMAMKANGEVDEEEEKRLERRIG